MTDSPEETAAPQEEQKEIRDFGTTPIQLHNDVPKITITQAIEYAVYAEESPDDVSLYFTPEDYERLGMVPGQLLGGVGKDGRTAANCRAVEKTGSDDHPSYRTSLSEDTLEALGIDPADITDDGTENPLVRLFGGEGIIAVERPEVKEITISSEVDLIGLLGPEAGRDYKAVVLDEKDISQVAQEHQRSQEMVEKNVRRAKERRKELEEAGYEL